MSSGRALRAVLARLNPGNGCRINHVGDQPFNRIAYQRINGIAYSLWGAGTYRLIGGRGATIIVRKAIGPTNDIATRVARGPEAGRIDLPADVSSQTCPGAPAPGLFWNGSPHE